MEIVVGRSRIALAQEPVQIFEKGVPPMPSPDAFEGNIALGVGDRAALDVYAELPKLERCRGRAG